MQESHGAAQSRAEAVPAPVVAQNRILSLDVLRGFAILGILLMNIQSFSMIGAAYFNPTAYGDLTGANRWVWILSHMFADTKFISIFSMLFGAGMVLFANRLEQKGLSAPSVHYRRVAWLLLIGLAHGILLWTGDILATYALVSMLIFLYWRRGPRTLLILGVLSILVSTTIYLGIGSTMPSWPPEAVDAMKEGMSSMWRPSPDAVAEELATFRGGWVGQTLARIPEMIGLLTGALVMYLGWRTGGMMLVGMALYKWGVLSAERSKRFYAWMTGIGLAIGYPIIAVGVARQFEAGWTLRYSFYIGSQYNYIGSAFVAFGYVGMVMLIVKMWPNGGFARLLAPVGRMAFTNYLLQTVICTTLFYGHGLGLFGSIERTGQVVVVLSVWAFEIWFSHFWLARFRFGPAEWLWRTLTYMRLQPMRRTA